MSKNSSPFLNVLSFRTVPIPTSVFARFSGERARPAVRGNHDIFVMSSTTSEARN